MFDVTPNEIAQLNDTDLRELVGRLCEADLASRKLSTAFVTWGGHQAAPDGGLDVRVALPAGTVIDGFIPRFSTGFQVKVPDMPRAAILTEMRPLGSIRPAIKELADHAGSYVIVSSHGSVADGALRSRRNALREALAGVGNADQLHTDFFDRTRLASWVRLHPGLITWVKEKVGRSLVGWHPYGAWAGAAEGVNAEYLLDDKMRLHLGKHRDAPARPVGDAIDELRDELAPAGRVVRLVGLSGVGKTRLVQALFDARIGLRSLPPSLAVYTNLSDNPDPQPTGLASDLIANRMRAVLIVDNCPPDLHRRLTELCAASGCTISVITVEYDVREDQPEDTQVVTLDTSSPELIEKLVKRRYSHLSRLDARKIAEISGGNARIAIALAETIKHSETIGGLSDEELFQRLFRQRHDPDSALLLGAQACSLVYSFEGEALTGEEAELPRLALLADQTPQALYRHVGELLRRDLIQQRSVWRALLPHAIANRLAARALEDIPFDFIDQQLVTGGTERLALSFSRRLSFLHEHPQALTIVKRWLSPGGLLGDVTTLTGPRQAMFENVAPVSPEAALAGLERAGNGNPENSAMVGRRYRSLLHSLAYDPVLFERSARLLERAATQSAGEGANKKASETFASLFTIHLSGTHASIEQRLGLIEQLLGSREPQQRSLGLAALDKVLQTTHFSPVQPFDFGARRRDYGFRPSGNEDIAHWFGSALKLIERLAVFHGVLKSELRNLVARNFRGLWATAHRYDELEGLSQKFAADEFWREGWAACRETMRFDKDRLSSDSLARLSALEAALRPSNLVDRVRAMVLSDRSRHLDLDDMDVDDNIPSEFDRLDAIARELGGSVAADEAVFTKLLPDLLRGGNRAWAFGCGLAAASQDRRTTWGRLVDCVEQLPLEKRSDQVMRGFLSELRNKDLELAQSLLDTVLDRPASAAFLPPLQSAVGIDARGVRRLKQGLISGKVPVWMYGYLALGRATDDVAGSDLKDLLLLIAERPNGFDVAVQVLHMRLHSDRSAQRAHEPDILEAGREALSRIEFKKNNQRDDHDLAGVVRTCLAGTGGGPVAAEVTRRLRQAVANDETYAFDNTDLLSALLSTQPGAVLDALFERGERDQQTRFALFDGLHDHRPNPADEISCEELIAWCDRDRERRYTLAASIVAVACRVDESGPQLWSKQAKALLANGPEPKNVLAVFVKRFRPMSWSGSRAAVIEANARLLDRLEPNISGELTSFLAEAKDQLARDVAAERRSETERDQVRDERFE